MEKGRAANIRALPLFSHGGALPGGITSLTEQSFRVEYSDWIKAHGAQRRDITGCDRDGGQYKSDANEGG